MASSTPPPVIRERRNLAELPPELTSSILHRLGAIEILENAQKVCRSWRRVCKDPSMWRKIFMHKPRYVRYEEYDLLEKMCRHAVNRSQGGLTEISIWQFGTDDLLNYIADSSSNLRSLKLEICALPRSQGIMEAVVKLPLLEDLEVSYFSLSGESLKVVGQSCPNLKTLKINGLDHNLLENDDFALAIAETMSGLRHLQLFGNGLTNVGLNAILDNCPNLEHLDLRQCFNLQLVGDLEKRCSERIKVIICPFMLDQFYWGEKMFWLGVAPQPLKRNHLLLEEANDENIMEAAQVVAKAIYDALSAKTRLHAMEIVEILSLEDGVSKAVRVLREEVGGVSVIK